MMGIGRERNLELLRLEPAIEDRAGGPRQHLDRPDGILAEPGETEAELGQLHQVAGSEGPRSGGCLNQSGFDERRDPLQHRLVFRQRLRVPGRELRHLAMGHFLVGPQQERATVGKWGEGRWAPGQHGKAMTFQFEIPDDLRAQEAVDVRRGRHLEPGPQLLGGTGAAQNLAAFEDHNLKAGPGGIGRGDESVVPTADNDQVVRSRHAELR